MKRLKKLKLSSLERELQVLKNPQNILGGIKGGYDDPYTQAEFDYRMDNGTWYGGFVEGWGFTGPNTTVWGSSTGSNNNNSGNSSQFAQWIFAGVKDIMGFDTPWATAIFLATDIHQNSLKYSGIELSQKNAESLFLALLPCTVQLGVSIVAEKWAEFNARIDQYFRGVASNAYEGYPGLPCY